MNVFSYFSVYAKNRGCAIAPRKNSAARELYVIINENEAREQKERGDL